MREGSCQLIPGQWQDRRTSTYMVKSVSVIFIRILSRPVFFLPLWFYFSPSFLVFIHFALPFTYSNSIFARVGEESRAGKEISLDFSFLNTGLVLIFLLFYHFIATKYRLCKKRSEHLKLSSCTRESLL